VTLRVRLFGQFQATWQDFTLSAPGRPRLQSLLAYLLLFHRYRSASRDHLAFTLWPGTSEAQAHANLRQYLHKLRAWLPSPADNPFLLIDSNEIHLNPDAPWWVDVWAFEDALSQGEACLPSAVELASCDLLPDLYDDWLLIERERLHLIYIRALARLVTLCQRHGDWYSALTWGQRLVADEPLDEQGQRLLMGVYYASGNRPVALQQFEDFRCLLQQELGVSPMPETLALHDAILRGEPLPGVGVQLRSVNPGGPCSW
jgi:DNA-binding SARP family transcriptional activator